MRKRGMRRVVVLLLALMLGVAGSVMIDERSPTQNGPQLVADPGASGGSNGG